MIGWCCECVCACYYPLCLKCQRCEKNEGQIYPERMMVDSRESDEWR